MKAPSSRPGGVVVYEYFGGIKSRTARCFSNYVGCSCCRTPRALLPATQKRRNPQPATVPCLPGILESPPQDNNANIPEKRGTTQPYLTTLLQPRLILHNITRRRTLYSFSHEPTSPTPAAAVPDSAPPPFPCRPLLAASAAPLSPVLVAGEGSASLPKPLAAAIIIIVTVGAPVPAPPTRGCCHAPVVEKAGLREEVRLQS